MRRPRSSTLAALLLTIALSLVGATTHARYLATIGPAECCRSHCHRHGATNDAADADRCCSVHLGVVPGALGPSSSAHHALVAVALPPAFGLGGRVVAAPGAPAPAVTLRGSPPTSLLAVHAALLI